jgi:hypothetical protein
MQISPALVRQYQELYERYNTPEYRERIDEIITMVKALGFQPSQMDDELEPPQVERSRAKPPAGFAVSPTLNQNAPNIKSASQTRLISRSAVASCWAAHIVVLCHL